MNDIGPQLLAIARDTIEHGLTQHSLRLPTASDYPAYWQTQRASFVTLKINAELRGCVGTTEAVEPLVVGVARNAYNAAFHDPRFTPLSTAEYPSLELSLSLLTIPEPIAFTNEAELLAGLVTGEDGLIIEHGRQRATFLPGVWDSLPQAEAFLHALKQKAGLAPNVVVERAWRYRSDTYSEL